MVLKASQLYGRAPGPDLDHHEPSQLYGINIITVTSNIHIIIIMYDMTCQMIEVTPI